MINRILNVVTISLAGFVVGINIESIHQAHDLFIPSSSSIYIALGLIVFFGAKLILNKG